MTAAAPGRPDIDTSVIEHLDFDHEVPCGSPQDGPYHPVGARRADYRLSVRGCSCVYLLCDQHTQWAIQALSGNGAVCDCLDRTIYRADVDITPLKA